ncbi:MAG: pyridoxal phosphate-dependent aminotransferase [Muribaculum sp.]|nr:pyridoxal phosphate-dependent aminotransferase [Muribaculum sp.]
MKYNFDELTDRHNSNSVKWDNADEEVLPMWVADMDFRTAPCIIDALEKRVRHGIFGYCHVPDKYYRATIEWMFHRHNVSFEREWIIYTSGVVPAISAVIKALTKPGDSVLVQTPVYNCFFSSIRNNDCNIVESPLIYDNQTYRIDFEDLEEKLSLPEVKIMLICNPHNPAGRVWTRAELQRIGELCFLNGVIPVSDEIHCELTFKGHDYTPFASVSNEFVLKSVTCMSPSKAFNIAGLQIANIICADSKWRTLIDKAININEVCDVNPFGVDALIAAYSDGEEWLDSLREYLWSNYLIVCDFMHSELPNIGVTRLEGTYLVWLDCRKLGMTSAEIKDLLYNKAKVWLTEGTVYGQSGEGFMRLNIACPKSRLIDGLNRIKAALSGNA